MGRIEKTVFISYRRTNLPWARAIFQDLTAHGYDAFFDFQSINSGDFSQVILENIKARAHFVLLLTPSALERCDDPNDWLRREIETAIDNKRNIVPVMLESFEFNSPDIIKVLTDKLALLKSYNGLRIHSDYFDEGMQRLRERYLNIALDAVLHPVSPSVKQTTMKQQQDEKSIPMVEQRELTAQEWFEKGNKAKEITEKIRYFEEAIQLDPEFSAAYNNLGFVQRASGFLDEAIMNLNKAIQINPDNTPAHSNRADVYRDKGDYKNAIKDYTQALILDPKHTSSLLGMGLVYMLRNEYMTAMIYLKKAIKIRPKAGIYQTSLINVLRKLGLNSEAEDQVKASRPLIEKVNEYNQACFESVCGNIEVALNLLKIGLEKGQSSKRWARQDPDLENLRDAPRFKEIVGE